MAEKRKLEFDSLSGVSETESADIHGVIASVSPSIYFDCKLRWGSADEGCGVSRWTTKEVVEFHGEI